MTVVLTETEDGVQGMTANAFMSVSLDPLLIALGVRRHGKVASVLARPEMPFTISVLAQNQQYLAEFYSRPSRLRSADPPGIARTSDGRAIIASAQAWIACQTVQVVEAGDHLLLVARAARYDCDAEKEPLIFYAGRYWEYLEREQDRLLEWLLLER